MGEVGTGAGGGSWGGVLSASEGAGPLLQRDYWAVIDRCGCAPSELMERVASRFAHFAPEDLTVFEREDGREAPLEPGDVLRVRIRGAGTARVRVIHRDSQSLTLATLSGHPEAGRITFGAYRNARGDVIFHIRSRARSGSRMMYLGFRTGGEPMQTNTWTDFVNAVALTVGKGVIGFIHAETRPVEPALEREDDIRGPTFLARGD